MSSFYPFALNLKGSDVLVFGGGEQALRETLKLVDAGAVVTLLTASKNAANNNSESTDLAFQDLALKDLLVTHASKIKALDLTPMQYLQSQPAPVLSKFALAFCFAADFDNSNDLLAQSLRTAGVNCHLIYQPEKSKFVTATVIKRGHLKIGVSTDGFCQPLEKAITRRIEELFVHDFDHYSLFLASVQERLAAFQQSYPESWFDLNMRLRAEPFFLAISRQNFEEALRIIDDSILQLSQKGVGEVEEVEINRPRQSIRGSK